MMTCNVFCFLRSNKLDVLVDESISINVLKTDNRHTIVNVFTCFESGAERPINDIVLRILHEISQ